MYIRIFIYIYVCVCVCVYIYVSEAAHTAALGGNMCVYIRVRTLCTSVTDKSSERLNLIICLCTYIHTYIYTYIYIYIHTNTHTHTHQRQRTALHLAAYGDHGKIVEALVEAKADLCAQDSVSVLNVTRLDAHRGIR